MDPGQTAPIGNVRQLFAADDFSRRHFQMHFFLGPLRVKSVKQKFNFLISQPKHMLWVLKRTVSMKHMLKLMGKKIITILRWKFLFI